ncbi:putative clathrin assembly protein [Capsicum chinense]|nr:putative clathrin assembly protein [Capsicum chinense]
MVDYYFPLAVKAKVNRLWGRRMAWTSMKMVTAESTSLYVVMADGILDLVDKFLHMQRHDAVRALEIYQRRGDQAVKLSEFFEICRNLDFGRGQNYLKIEKVPHVNMVLAITQLRTMDLVQW